MSNENKNEVFNGINGIDDVPVDTPETEEEVPMTPVDNRTRLQKFADSQAEKKAAREMKKANKKAAKAAKGDKGLTTKEKIAIGAGGGLLIGGLILRGIMHSAVQNNADDYELVDDEDEQETPCFPVDGSEDETVETEENETAQEET